MFGRRPRTLVDLIRADLARDPGDAPAVYLEADLMADDMARMPEAVDPNARQRVSSEG